MDATRRTPTASNEDMRMRQYDGESRQAKQFRIEKRADSPLLPLQRFETPRGFSSRSELLKQSCDEVPSPDELDVEAGKGPEFDHGVGGLHTQRRLSFTDHGKESALEGTHSKFESLDDREPSRERHLAGARQTNLPLSSDRSEHREVVQDIDVRGSYEHDRDGTDFRIVRTDFKRQPASPRICNGVFPHSELYGRDDHNDTEAGLGSYSRNAMMETKIGAREPNSYDFRGDTDDQAQFKKFSQLSSQFSNDEESRFYRNREPRRRSQSLGRFQYDYLIHGHSQNGKLAEDPNGTYGYMMPSSNGVYSQSYFEMKNRYSQFHHKNESRFNMYEDFANFPGRCDQFGLTGSLIDNSRLNRYRVDGSGFHRNANYVDFETELYF